MKKFIERFKESLPAIEALIIILIFAILIMYGGEYLIGRLIK